MKAVILYLALLAVVSADRSKRSIVCTIGGDKGCKLECEILHHVGGSCDEHDNCVCDTKAAEEPAASEEREKRNIVCTIGGDKGCKIECEILHHVGGSCDEDNNCVCDTKAAEEPAASEEREKRNIVCTIGGDKGCNLECEILHHVGGSCDEHDNCVCDTKAPES